MSVYDYSKLNYHTKLKRPNVFFWRQTDFIEFFKEWRDHFWMCKCNVVERLDFGPPSAGLSHHPFLSTWMSNIRAWLLMDLLDIIIHPLFCFEIFQDKRGKLWYTNLNRQIPFVTKSLRRCADMTDYLTTWSAPPSDLCSRKMQLRSPCFDQYHSSRSVYRFTAASTAGNGWQFQKTRREHECIP